jgi:EpsI family protein
VCIVGILALGLTLGLSRAVEFREKMPSARPFNQFPMEIGEWTGRRQFMDQIFLNALFFNDYILANYQNREGREINLYVAYYDSQTKGESIQPPSTDLPARWTFRESKNAKVILIAHSLPSIEVNRAFMEKQGAKQLVYFWYPMRGRVLTEPYQVKLTNFWDAVTRRRTDGALVRVITPVHKGERMIDAEVRLAGFVREVVPILDQFIPK